MSPVFLAPFAALFLLVPDEVVFKNGEKVVGKVVSVGDGKITIDSKSLGTVKAALADVATFSTDEPVELVLQDGSVVKQKVQAAADGTVMIEKEGVAEPQKVALGSIKKINPPAVRWTGDLSAGLIFTRGNSDTDNANVTFNAERRTDDDRITFKAYYASTRTKDQATNEWATTQARIGGKLQYDYFFTKTLYGFAFAAADKDRIAFLDLRFLTGAGAGQQWLDSKEISFSTEEAITWTKEDYNNGTPNDDYAGAMLAYHLNGTIAGGLTGFNNVLYNQSLEDIDDSFVYGDIGVRAALTSAMFIELKATLRWDNTPANGAERTDVQYIANIGWGF